VAAGGTISPASHAALETLCQAYWYPLYAYLRRRGHSPEDSQDLAQEFFRRLLASDWIARADPAKGRFRSFLLGGLQNFLANDWQKGQRLKRGGGRGTIALDALDAEERYRLEPAEVASPDKLFERRWALTILERILDRLAKEEEAAGAGARFQTLREVLLGEPSSEGYASLARRFNVTESTVKSWVHRLRRRYRELLRKEVAETVNSPEEVQEELHYLMGVLSS
jgi:RNA polymerase sigma-70 factor (ECF subfamily)